MQVGHSIRRDYNLTYMESCKAASRLALWYEMTGGWGGGGLHQGIASASLASLHFRLREWAEVKEFAYGVHCTNHLYCTVLHLNLDLQT